MSKSIKKNYILNLVNTILGIIFPLITFPYASRILMADGIGLVNFYNSIINYIILFSAVGIPMYAIRESARVRDNIKLLSITTTEILILHTLLCAFGYIAVGVICLTIAEVQNNIPIFLLLSTSIILSAIGVNWFYQGIEDFTYITIRNILVKVVTIILLFSIVHEKSDLILYAFVLVVGNVGNNVFNFFRLRKHISVSCFSIKEIHPFRHLVPSLKIWVLNLVISIYTQLDVIMLGFIKDITSVGYFTAAHNITNILFSLTTSLGTVLLPRLSNLISSHQIEEFKRLSQKAINFAIFISLPIMGGVMVMSPTIIHLFCGNSFEPSILCLQIQAPIILIIALSNVVGMQILYPQGKENIVTISTIVGALINVILNLILIPSYSHNGAAISTLIAETAVTITMILIGIKSLPVKFITRRNFKVLMSSLIMSILCYYFMKILHTDISRAILIPIIGSFLYILLLLINKDPLVKEMINIVIKKRI